MEFDFVSLFLKLLYAYVYDAAPFMVLHMIVLFLLFREFLKIRTEIRHLERYIAGEANVNNSETPQNRLHSRRARTNIRGIITNQLKSTINSSFIRQVIEAYEQEVRVLGRKGLIAPMTDFTDRIDAVASQMINRVSDYASLLLIIGIAGTMFGVFEFAYRAHAVGMESGGVLALSQLSLVLAESMAKAFPVGFVGLVLMFIAQYIISIQEDRLYKKISEASQHALRIRKKAVITKREALVDITEELVESLKPLLSDLQKAVQVNIEPFISTFSKEMNQILAEVHKQTVSIEASAARVTEAISQSSKLLHEQLTVLQASANVLPNQLHELSSLLDKHRKQLSELSRRTEKSFSRIEEVINRIVTLFEQIIEYNREFSQKIYSEISEVWNKNVEVLVQELRREYAQWTTHILDATKSLKTKLDEAADALKNYASSSQELLTVEFKKSVEKALKVADQKIDLLLISKYPEAIDKVDKLTKYMTDISEEFRKVADMISITNKHMETAIYALEEVIKRVREASRVDVLSDKLDAIVLQLEEIKQLGLLQKRSIFLNFLTWIKNYFERVKIL